jgi:hypothetical protein
MPHRVTLSEAKGLSRRTSRCFAEFTLSEANGLSMTASSRMLLPSIVTLSPSEGSIALGPEMLRYVLHDSIFKYVASLDCHPEPQRRVYRAGPRDASLRLSMTGLPHSSLQHLIGSF